MVKSLKGMTVMSKVVNQIKKKEISRFKKAIKKAGFGLQQKKFGTDFENYEKFCQQIDSLSLLLGKAIETSLEKTLPLGEKEKGRATLEIKISGLRYFTKNFPKSFLFKCALPLLGLENIQEEIGSFCRGATSYLHDCQICLLEIEKYAEIFQQGKDLAAKYKQEKRQQLINLYASLKMWETDSDFETFSACFEKTMLGAVEIFIEGPIKLYLMIGKDKFLIIIKAATLENIAFPEKNEKELTDLIHLHKFVYQLVEDSEMLKLLPAFLKECLKEYHKLWRKEQMELRNELINKEQRLRFIRNFESGVLFQNTTQ
ncbi:MAG: hypothetical protein HY813_00630 [Candidatus Portnoybacteria bacterium]|nr:hypothetical protein [Candidatus Portnoybacteria bacterium]